ncbi:hypothetical protein Tco_0448398 [Tanacetum coccineum]
MCFGTGQGNDMDNQSVHAMQDFEQTPVVDFSDNEITSDSNIIPYSQYLEETQQAAVKDTNLYAQQDSMILSVIEEMSEQMINHVNNWEKANQEKNNESLAAELERYKERVKTFEHRLNIDLSTRKKMIDSQMDDMIKEKLALKQQIDSLEQNLSNQIKEKESLLQTFTKAQRIKPTLYDGSVISSQHAVNPVIDDEETLILEEVSRSKMLAKQNNLISKEKKINTILINYVELNRLSEDFGKQFGSQQELFAEQAFWLQTSHPNTDQSATSPVKIEAPREIPKVSLVNKSLKKLKYHIGKFDTVVKKRITPAAITEGEWGFKHTKKVFNEEVIPFKNSLQTLVKDFENGLLNELNDVKTVFNQMEVVVDQYVVTIVMHADVKVDNVLHVPNTFLDENIALDVMKMENDRLMYLLVSQDLVHTDVNSLAAINDYKSIEKIYIEEYERNLKLATELSQMNELSKTCSRLEQRCMSLELKLQHNKESFQNDKPCENQDAPEFHEFFIINELKAQLQANDTTIINLKKHIQELKGKSVNDCREYVNNPKVSVPTVLKLDLEPLYSKLKNNREAHYFNPPARVVSPDLVDVSAPKVVDPAGSPSSTTIDQDVLHRQIRKFNLNQNRRDLPKDIPLDRIEVLRYDTKGVKVRKGKMQTKTELTLEQTQQGVSDEVLVSIEGVEE